MSGWLAASAGAGTWHVLTTSFGMVVETFWALALGFGLSGAIRAGDGGRLRATLGDRRPRTLARASAYGMASSSCSYAAAAMARSLVRKGADFVSSMAFMIASTNLVVELGLVLVALLGWRFAAAEFVGGTIL
ncbi:MAG TPA: permease, partial [Acidimicrobiales bacterium]|nr:permease [Acidimicrobiales bacterium]